MEYVIIYSSKKISDIFDLKNIVKNTIYIDRDSISKKYDVDKYLRIWFSDYLAEKLKQKDFVIVEKKKKESMLLLAKAIQEEIEMFDIDIKKIPNDIRYDAMVRFFNEYEFSPLKLLKDRLEDIKNEIKFAKGDGIKYWSLRRVIDRVLKIQEEIREKDITDNKCFSNDIAEKFFEAKRFERSLPPL